MSATPFTPEQSRLFIDAQQVYEALEDARQQLRRFRGGMHWKTVKGREYLYRTLDGRGHAVSLGARSEHTEQTIQAFREGQREVTERVASLRQQVAERATSFSLRTVSLGSWRPPAGRRN